MPSFAIVLSWLFFAFDILMSIVAVKGLLEDKDYLVGPILGDQFFGLYEAYLYLSHRELELPHQIADRLKLFLFIYVIIIQPVEGAHYVLRCYIYAVLLLIFLWAIIPPAPYEWLEDILHPLLVLGSIGLVLSPALADLFGPHGLLAFDNTEAWTVAERSLETVVNVEAIQSMMQRGVNGSV